MRLIWCILLACTALQSFAEDKIAFVYELVRHGARAPVMENTDPGKFDVPGSMLTRSGMRQRWLVGRYNRKRYIERQGLLDSEYNPNQMWVQSTPVLRTL